MPNTPAYRSLLDAMSRLARAQRAAAADVAREAGCPRALLGLLWLLAKHGEMGASDAARHLHVGVSVASRQLSAMVDLGFAERSNPDAAGADRRSRSIRVTAVGLAFAAETHRRLEERAAQVFGGWTPAELAAAAAELERVADALELPDRRRSTPPSRPTTNETENA